MQLKVVWSLLLQADSEGPALIFCAASWRTYEEIILDKLEPSPISFLRGGRLVAAPHEEKHSMAPC